MAHLGNLQLGGLHPAVSLWRAFRQGATSVAAYGRSQMQQVRHCTGCWLLPPGVPQQPLAPTAAANCTSAAACLLARCAARCAGSAPPPAAAAAPEQHHHSSIHIPAGSRGASHTTSSSSGGSHPRSTHLGRCRRCHRRWPCRCPRPRAAAAQHHDAAEGGVPPAAGAGKPCQHVCVRRDGL